MSSTEEIVKGKRVLFTQKFRDESDAVVAYNDVLEFLKTIPDETVMLVVTSPPYNIGKIYEKRTDFDKYLEWQKDVIKECTRILKPEGSICWEVGNYIEDGEVFPLDIYFYTIFKELGLKLRNRIIWRFEHGLHATKRLSGRYETIVWFTKGDTYTFNLDKIRIPQKYPGKLSYKGANIGKPSGNPLGKNPSDVWDIVCRDWEEEVWNIPNVKSNHPEKTHHPCQYPIELIERLVIALTNEEDYVFDPFMGVGSSLIAALLHNRKAIGVDKEKEYAELAYRRVIQAVEGKLEKRPLGKPVHKPTGREKILQRPVDWENQKLES